MGVPDDMVKQILANTLKLCEKNEACMGHIQNSAK
jgi:hypothetical protein